MVSPDLRVLPSLEIFTEEFAATTAGVAEMVIPPGSSVISKTPKDLRFRRTFGMSLLAIHRGEESMSLVETDDHEATRIGKVVLQSGDTLVVHTPLNKFRLM